LRQLASWLPWLPCSFLSGCFWTSCISTGRGSWCPLICAENWGLSPGVGAGAVSICRGYDALGNRTSQDQHSVTGGTDTTTSYAYNGDGASQPGALDKGNSPED
jgi:hypothetical protein